MSDRRYLDPDRLWPHLPAGWIVARGRDWLGVARPSGVAAGEGGGGDGLAARLELSHPSGAGTRWRAVLPDPVGARGGAEASRAASGVALMARGAGLGRALRRAEAAGALRLRWVVGVLGWPASGSRGWAARAALETAGAEVVGVRSIGDRSLLEVVTRGLDREVAAVLGGTGFRVAGMPRGDEPGAGPMMLHLGAVGWSEARVRAPAPEHLEAWIRAAPEPFEARLERALLRRHRLGRDPDTDCFRLLDDESDLTLDAYGSDLVVSSYVELPSGPTPGPELVGALFASARSRAAELGERLGARRVFLKLRPRRANTVVDAVRAGLSPAEPVWAAPEHREAGPAGGALEVVENGLRYRVELGAGLSTGVFLDQRENRAWVRANARDLRVLNTFAYTCAFSVAAAVGGARRTVSIDAAAPALESGRRNLALNGCDDPERHDLIRGDVLRWLPKMARRGDRFDLVVLDPPSYSRVGKRRFSALRDYPELVAATLGVLVEGGRLLACINDARCDRRRLHQMVLRGCRAAGRSVAEIAHQPAAIDHPTGRMKSVLVRIGC